jgi:hypothetical protein
MYLLGIGEGTAKIRGRHFSLLQGSDARRRGLRAFSEFC